jgi:uncharacterized tellurite resistance protein B-like protein
VATDPDLLLGRALIAAAWADGKLDAEERDALEDLLLEIDDISPDTWRALHADLQRPFDDEHRERIFGELDQVTSDPAARRRTVEMITALIHRLGPGSEEAKLLDGLARDLESTTQDAPGGGIMARLAAAVSAGVGRRSGEMQRKADDERAWEKRMRDRLADHWPEDEDWPEDDSLHRLCVGAAILAHVVRLDGSVDPGEIAALEAAIRDQWGLGDASARLATDLVLDETAAGLDLHLLLRAFQRAATEDERKRFLAAVFTVAAGDGIATYDEIEEVRRIGRGLLLSHKHFISAKLSVPDERRDT